MFNLSNLLFFCSQFLLIPGNLSYYLHFFYSLLVILPCYLQLNPNYVILRLKRGSWSPELLEGEPDLNGGPQTPFIPCEVFPHDLVRNTSSQYTKSHCFVSYF